MYKYINICFIYGGFISVWCFVPAWDVERGLLCNAVPDINSICKFTFKKKKKKQYCSRLQPGAQKRTLVFQSVLSMCKLFFFFLIKVVFFS